MSSAEGSKKTKLAVVLATIAVLASAGFGVFIVNQDKAAPNSNQTVQVPEEDATEIKPTEFVSYKGVDGKSALELLKGQARVETKSSSLGEYVTSINGNDGGGQKYWMFYVDGKEATVGADAYMTKNSETIEWKLQ